MRLLVLTQAVDKNDLVLGFLHGWLAEFSKHFQHIEVVCLKEGKHELPRNVSVQSLGKERGASRLAYIYRFYRYVWSLQHGYDAVLVHMNQEYVLLAGLVWRLMGKRVYLWRNHYAGGFMTDIAVLFCTKIFCTSKLSYTAKYQKTLIMPVGIDTNVFKSLNLPRKAKSILSLGRIAPSKRIDVLIEAIGILAKKGISTETHVYGDPLPKDANYHDSLMRRADELGLGNVQFHPGVRNDETPKIFSAHDIFVNCSGSGMYDKTIFEAAACGCLVLASSRDFSEFAGHDFSFGEGNVEELAAKIEQIMSLSKTERESARAAMRALVEHHSLHELGEKLANEMQ